MEKNKKLSAIVLGFGSRGNSYSHYAVDNPEKLEIVAVAEPLEHRRLHAKETHKLPDDRIFSDWRDLVALPKIADFAIITTLDKMHCEPALALIEKGYNLLLEKPMAPTPEECKQIAEAAERKGVKVIVCHVLRYTEFWNTLKDLIDSGEIGEIMSIVHMENVGHIHQSHSFVRGIFRNSNLTSPMILQKCCHDTDILQWLIGKKCTKVQSFGSLTYFTKKNQPEGATDRCTDGCPYVKTCPYSAVKLYIDDKSPWRASVTQTLWAPTDEEVMEALKTGLHGRCVYTCDNNVVDHQIVNMEFEGGITASLSMNAFNKGGRVIRVFGTKGEISLTDDEHHFRVFSFDTQTSRDVPIRTVGNTIESGHGGGDTGIMDTLTDYFANDITSKRLSDARTSYISHLIAFAAEESRLTGKVIDLDEYSNAL